MNEQVSPVLSLELDDVRRALASRYDVQREIGQGGTAVVYSARDPRLDRIVAIKVLQPELAVTLGAERFLREIKIESTLEHPNILSLHESGRAGQYLYYVMPFVEGESLRERLRREGTIGLDDALELVGQVASGLDYAIQRDIVHRDIKPGNILLSSGQAVIADFGLAQAISDVDQDALTASGIALGTPHYMSPEQASGERVDGRSDVYSLGCVLFELLTGEPPFAGRNAQAIIARHMAERPPSLEVVRPDIPPHVALAVRRALAKTPADRFATAGQFVEALKTGVALPIPPARRWPWLVVAGVVGMVGWLLFKPDPILPDSNKIVVFPLQTVGSVANQGVDGIDVALMIGSALEHTDPLKWIDGWHRLDETQRNDITQLTAAGATAIARDRGARYYLSGTVRRSDENLTVVLQLHDALGDSVVTQESATGTVSASSASQLGLTALIQVLPTVVEPGRTFDLTPLMDRDPAAVAIWLQGEREYRQARFEPALEYYRRAVSHDSLLAFASLKGAQAAGWTDQMEEAESFAAMALSAGSLLPPRYRDFARGLWHYFRGNADSAVTHLRSALTLRARWSEASMALAEVYHHLLPSDLVVDSSATALFEAAIEDDPDFSPPLVHLAEEAIRHGRIDVADSLMHRIRRIGPDVTIANRLSLMIRCVRDGPLSIDWSEVASSEPLVVMEAAKVFSAAASQPGCAEAGFRAVRHDPGLGWGSTLGLQGLLVAQGRETEAIALLDSALASGMQGALAAYLLNSVSRAAGESMDKKGQYVVDLVRDLMGNDYDLVSNPQSLYLLGLWHAEHDNFDEVSVIRDVLVQRQSDGPEGERSRMFAHALNARSVFRFGTADEAIDALSESSFRTMRSAVTWEIGDPMPADHLLLAELLREKGRLQEANRIAAWLDHPAPLAFLPFLPYSLKLRIQIAEQLGDQDLAEQLRARMRDLGRTPDSGEE